MITFVLILSVFFILPSFSRNLPLMFVVAVVISVGIAYMVYYLKGKHIEFINREKSLKKGIKAEEDVGKVLMSLDSGRFSVYRNVEVKEGDKVFDLDYVVVDRQKGIGYFIDVKSYSGSIYVDSEGFMYINGQKRNFKPGQTLLRFRSLFKRDKNRLLEFGIRKYMLVVVFPYSRSVRSEGSGSVSYMTLDEFLSYVVR